MRASWWKPAVVVAAVIGLMAAADQGASALNELLLRAPGIDKVLHFVGACLLFLWLRVSLRHMSGGDGPRSAAAAAATASLLLIDEAQQQWVGARTVELADLGVGFTGLLVGLAFVYRSRWPRLATAGLACGVAAAGAVTYESHLETRDYNWGVLAERRGQQDEALDHYRAAVARGVSNPEAYNALAWTILQTGNGDPREAARYAERSLALRPANPDALDTYGWALYRAGQATRAVPPLEQALAGKPDIYCIHFHLGMAYLDAGRRDEGLQQLRLQIEHKPSTAEARLSATVLARVSHPEARR